MNPVIVIPSCWDRSARVGALGERGVYDYTTPIDKPLPELEVCLSSLERVSGVLRVIVLVVAPKECEDAARARVNSICRSHADLNPLVIGAKEAAHVERAVARMAHHVAGETVSLRGYGAIRNMGLAVAAVLGHDVVVFLDDDEVVTESDFLTKAVWGLGSLTRQNLQVLAKSGFFIDRLGSPYAEPSSEWSEKYWSKAADFNRVMERAQTSASRITRSNHLCGGCCALHAAAFSKVPFDPYITRGEDLDYVLNLRANGMDAWFDNEWYVEAQPPEEMAGAPSVFMQDVHRWLYEYRKLDAMNARRDLRTITPESLMPYPAPWLSAEVRRRVFRTALRRLITGPDRLAYLRILTKGRYEADKFARSASSRYLSFAMVWPTIVSALWGDRVIASAILSTGQAAPRAVHAAPTAPESDPLADTGAFPVQGGAR
ncbi:MAG TPA: hypothetical protein IAA22_08020 [Candidatus Olsenella stercoravium]|uniref:Uncharacterized protein n=1 Tax=Candidatus Olsenella stercoravium TaxID=2838713 RepID=A0A9D2IQ37_9ACTN|nr:hypothetical protein [Candidatus Olsenella stercoravium]